MIGGRRTGQDAAYESWVAWSGCSRLPNPSAFQGISFQFIDFTGKMPIPKRQRLRRCQACGQFAVYCGKWGEEWVWRCKYCGFVVQLTDEEICSLGLRKD